MSDPHTTFAAAFNARDLSRLTRLLTPDATAEVLGSPFPVERGRKRIARTSLRHVLEEQAPLIASTADAGRERWILLRGARGTGPVDTAIRLGIEGASIRRLEYVVAPHEPDRLREIGEACGVATLADAID